MSLRRQERVVIGSICFLVLVLVALVLTWRP
jgi:hypothetical protein